MEEGKEGGSELSRELLWSKKNAWVEKKVPFWKGTVRSKEYGGVSIGQGDK